MISPKEIRTKAKGQYRRYLDHWIRGEQAAFFPKRIPVRLKLPDAEMGKVIESITRLRQESKEVRGVGYTVHWETRRSRRWGTNPFPVRVTVDTREDLLELAGRAEHFARTSQVVQRVRSELPQLEDWLQRHVGKLAGYADRSEGLIAVAKYFLDHPWPDCYARQVPAGVDTKFIERNRSVLRQWLDELLPASAIRADEQEFYPRFGLRDGQLHWTIRILDRRLQAELALPFDECSLPMRHLADWQLRGATVIIVENRTNLMTLPPVERGIGIRGEGKAVTRFRDLSWLRDNQVVYWGDVDVEGFQILSSLRRLFPEVRSLLMDASTLEAHANLLGAGSGAQPECPALLTEAEGEAFGRCRSENLRLEQEKIPQDAVDAAFAADRSGCERLD